MLLRTQIWHAIEDSTLPCSVLATACLAVICLASSAAAELLLSTSDMACMLDAP